MKQGLCDLFFRSTAVHLPLSLSPTIFRLFVSLRAVTHTSIPHIHHTARFSLSLSLFPVCANYLLSFLLTSAPHNTRRIGRSWRRAEKKKKHKQIPQRQVGSTRWSEALPAFSYLGVPECVRLYILPGGRKSVLVPFVLLRRKAEILSVGFSFHSFIFFTIFVLPLLPDCFFQFFFLGLVLEINIELLDCNLFFSLFFVYLFAKFPILYTSSC